MKPALEAAEKGLATDRNSRSLRSPDSAGPVGMTKIKVDEQAAE
jgi:hypothetical protein